MLGTSCDMFSSTSNSKCHLEVWQNFKTAAIYDLLKPDVESTLFMMQCSGSQENMVSNSDLSNYNIQRNMMIF